MSPKWKYRDGRERRAGEFDTSSAHDFITRNSILNVSYLGLDFICFLLAQQGWRSLCSMRFNASRPAELDFGGDQDVLVTFSLALCPSVSVLLLSCVVLIPAEMGLTLSPNQCWSNTGVLAAYAVSSLFLVPALPHRGAGQEAG